MLPINYRICAKSYSVYYLHSFLSFKIGFLGKPKLVCFFSHKDASSEEKVVMVSWEATNKMWLLYNFDISLFLRVTLILAIVMNCYTCSRRTVVRSKYTSTSHEQIAIFHYAWKSDTAHLYKIQSCITVLLRIWGSMVYAKHFHVLACATRKCISTWHSW
jgi:hypothetical protein